MKRLLLAGFISLALSPSLFARGRQPPALHFTIDPSTVTAGNTLSVTMRSESEFEKAFITFHHKRSDFYPVGGNEWRALIGLTSTEPPGRKAARFTVELSKRHVHQSTVAFVVQAGTYPVSRLKLTKQKDALVKQMEHDAKILDAVYRTPGVREKLWDGLFVMPATGIVSSVYGARRAYGPRKFTQPHTGVDIANKTGTEIFAPNRGKVAFVGWLDSFGNAVVLDHGQGVFSYYLHMEKSLVKEGDMAESGTLLGLMGSEGVATGPHLHWSFVVGGVRVDALEWTRRVFR